MWLGVEGKRRGRGSEKEGSWTIDWKENIFCQA
jgi:hypothetical protein